MPESHPRWMVEAQRDELQRRARAAQRALEEARRAFEAGDAQRLRDILHANTAFTHGDLEVPSRWQRPITTAQSDTTGDKTSDKTPDTFAPYGATVTDRHGVDVATVDAHPSRSALLSVVVHDDNMAPAEARQLAQYLTEAADHMDPQSP